MLLGSQEGQLLCERSATILRKLKKVYCKFTSSNGSDDNGHCYIMPKLQKLLSVLIQEFTNKSQSQGEKLG